MRADAVVQGSVPPRSGTGTDTEAKSLQLIVELAMLGLVSAEVGADGAFMYELTPTGTRAARQAAMRRDPHALVLLGALMGEGESLN